MCGIAGVFDYGNVEPGINFDLLQSMSSVIAHRGPDSDGHWISGDNRCGLAFRRLAIIDLSPAGNQPMTTPDGRFTIVFNGEIYNHNEIRSRLIGEGYSYRSRTDTETILYGYARYGKEVVNYLYGMFAFAVWDNEKSQLFCARDRIGIKPLYFTSQNGRFVFGSEIKSILQHPAIKAELNIDELPNYLNFGISSNRHSLFASIDKLPSGHRMTVAKDGNISLERYWHPLIKSTNNTKIDSHEAQEEIIRLLRLAVKDRMMSDVPFGVFLSGGIDSSLNVALMSEYMDRPVDTYTVGFKELEKYNELGYARKIAKLYETNHHEILIDHDDAFGVLDELVWHEDEPNADPVCMPLYFLSKLTRQSGTIVIQVGEGSDEQFVGYPWMMREYNFYMRFWKPYTKLPVGLKKSIYNMSAPIFKMMRQNLALDYLWRGSFGYELYWSGMSIISPTHMRSMFAERLRDKATIPAEYAKSLHAEALGFNPAADYLQRILYIEQQQRLAELLLMRVDKICMAHSIEARVPFLDHRLVEFTASLPPTIKTPDRKTTKYLLKKAVEPILPHDIIYRPKQGFWAPVNEWLRYQWHDYAKDKILHSKLAGTGIFDSNALKQLLESHRLGKESNGVQIFSLLMLDLWMERFIK